MHSLNSNKAIRHAANETIAWAAGFFLSAILVALIVEYEGSIQSFGDRAQLAVWYILTLGMSVWGGVANAAIAATAFYFVVRTHSLLADETTNPAEFFSGRLIVAGIITAIWYVLSLIALDNLPFNHDNAFEMVAIVFVHLPAPIATLLKVVD